MGKEYDALNDKLISFIERQKMFFVATAPLTDEGHVNVSPKGYDSFAILGPNEVAFCDLGGSGAETIAHIRDNGRITIMFCAFEGAALILRLYGKATVTQFNEPGFAEAMKSFPDIERARSVIKIKVTRIADSCGWSVPFYEFQSERDQLRRHVGVMPFEDWKEKRLKTNAQSIDGLPAVLRYEDQDDETEKK